jgi:hypothetical protein
MLEIEDDLFPEFNVLMQDMSNKIHVPYLDMTSSSYQGKFRYLDGNHFYRESAKDVSAEIARWINSTN